VAVGSRPLEVEESSTLGEEVDNSIAVEAAEQQQELAA
jgi:hypothetical protein